MPEETPTQSPSVIPQQPMSERGSFDGRRKDEITAARTLERMESFDQIAAGLYSVASMLVGEARTA